MYVVRACLCASTCAVCACVRVPGNVVVNHRALHHHVEHHLLIRVAARPVWVPRHPCILARAPNQEKPAQHPTVCESGGPCSENVQCAVCSVRCAVRSVQRTSVAVIRAPCRRVMALTTGTAQAPPFYSCARCGVRTEVRSQQWVVCWHIIIQAARIVAANTREAKNRVARTTGLSCPWQRDAPFAHPCLVKQGDRRTLPDPTVQPQRHAIVGLWHTRNHFVTMHVQPTCTPHPQLCSVVTPDTACHTLCETCLRHGASVPWG